MDTARRRKMRSEMRPRSDSVEWLSSRGAVRAGTTGWTAGRCGEDGRAAAMGARGRRWMIEWRAVDVALHVESLAEAVMAG